MKQALMILMALAGTAAADSASVPDVFDMTQADAEAALRKAGFSGRITIDTQSVCGSVVNGKIIEVGKICYQSPAVGRPMPTKLSLLVRIQREDPRRGPLANGRFWFLMPDFTGVSLDDARAKLKELGFTKEPVIGRDKSCKPNIVCRQNPAPLTRGDSSSDKLLVVGPS